MADFINSKSKGFKDLADDLSSRNGDSRNQNRKKSRTGVNFNKDGTSERTSSRQGSRAGLTSSSRPKSAELTE